MSKKKNKEQTENIIREEERELDKSELIEETKTTKEKSEAADYEDADLCDNCYKQGEKIILTKGQDRCPNCGNFLDWR